MYGCELDPKEGWAPKNWCFWIVLEKTLESPLDSKEIQPVHPKGNQSWIFIGRTDAEAEAPIFGHLMWRTASLEKTLMLGKTEGRRRGLQRMRCWMASQTWWTWVWARSGSWWWTGKPGVLLSMGSQRVRPDWATELNWTDAVSVLIITWIIHEHLKWVTCYACNGGRASKKRILVILNCAC